MGRGEDIPGLLARLREGAGGYGAEREAAMEALLRLGEAAAGPLLEGLKGASREALRAATDALARCADPRGAPGARALLAHPDPGLRRAAVLMLAASLEAEARPDLLAAAGDADGWVRGEAFHALGDLPRALDAEGALRAGLRDPDLSARRAAARVLRAWGVELDEEERARAGAAEGERAAIAALGPERAALLVDCLRSGDTGAGQAALERLARLLRDAPGELPREALVSIERLPPELEGRVIGTVFSGPDDETGHLDVVPVKLELTPLRRLALAELKRRKAG